MTGITPEGFERLKDEIEYLSTDRRREVAERIRVAREFGDIAENAEYDTAKNEHFSVGDTIGVAAVGPVQQFRIVGIAKYGDVESLGGATFAVFTVPEARKLLHVDG